ncbi:Putative zinc-finger domain [Musa troglodytarum]|uniref:Zinc-finger domain n=1 Tax=Musa troglodytarum TaxID=320322 RepID=A0A9E7EXJ3_9LILI|nr:Putative zinc-finger domain [Musa troglodytarum]
MVETGNFPPPKPAAPAPAPSPANPSSKSPSREDGELSSGEDAELTTSTAAFANKALSEPILVSTRNRVVRNLQTGNSSSIAKTKFHTSTKRYYDKTFRTKQVPFKLNKNRALSWHKKISDDNLVISFSDDDSGTDSENSKPQATTEKKDNAVRSVKCKMPVTLSRTQHEILQRSTQFGTRLKSNKGVAGSVPFSSTGKNNGSNFGPPRTSSSEKVKHIQKQITALKSSISQVHGQIRDTVLADSAVESLRHQIALRENELKVQMKLAQNKDRVTGSYNDHLEQLNQKLDNQVADIDGAATANAKGPALNIRPTKRLKLDEHFERIQGSDGLLLMREHSTKSMAESHQQLMGESSSLEVNSVLGYDGSEKGKSLSIINQEINKSHHDVNENVLGSSKVKHAGLEDNETLLPSFATDSTLYADPKMNTKQQANSKITGDASCNYLKSDNGPELLASALLDQSLYLAQTAPALEKLLVPSNSPLEKFSVDALQNNSHDAGGGISEWGTVNLESLLEMEELQDKELEEAQELRRQCELEERHALKAYRKAQRALIKANERCVILHRNREIISAKLQTLMLESSNSIWPSNEQGHGESMLFSRLGYSIPTKGQTSEHLGDKLNHNFLDGAPPDASYKQTDRHGSCANQFSEPDDSTSEQRDNSAANGLGSPFQNLSTDDDEENLALDNRYVESNLACLIDAGNHVEETSDADANKDGDSQDYDLEAALRSKLVARFGMRTSCKSADISNIECQVDQAINSKVEKSCTSFDQQLQEQKKTFVSNPEGISKAGGSMNLSSVEHCGQSQQCMFSLKGEAHRNDDPAESSSFLNETCLSVSKPILSLPSSILHNVLPLLKFKTPACHSEVSITKEKGSLMDKSHEVTACLPDAIDDYTQRSARNPKKFIQGLPDSEQSLELALDLFCGKLYKPERKKALSVLSRAIEADPNSICLWVVYLHIFYRKEKSIGKDDMFFHAVQHNGCSYELWLMYINSRVKVNDRVEKAVRRIYELSSGSDSEQAVMYKKLPQEIVQHFEAEKDLPFSIDWPFVQLTTDETDRVGELMKFALQRVALDVDENHQKRDRTALRSLHFLAVSHVRLELLSRRYYQSIKKSRIRQLIDEIIGSVPADFSLVNSVLEACYGPTLLPEKIDPKDLVDFVESLMEFTPANYQLALSVYKFIARNYSDSGVASDGVVFWGSCVLVNSIFQSAPVAPESVWLEAAALLRNSKVPGIAERFYQQALSIYPFSVKFWKSDLDLSKMTENEDVVTEAARERGLELNTTPD